MIVKTRIFELSNSNYKNLSQLARAMGISVSQIYRVRKGKRGINQKFIVGAIKAFPDYRLGELFYLAPSVGDNTWAGEIPAAKNDKHAREGLGLAGRRRARPLGRGTT
jgi:transcriptional regulator with XRE-family HTH domain